MGMCDYLYCEVELPEHGIQEGVMFSTRTLFCSGVKLTINRQGRLIEHRVRYESTKQPKLTSEITLPFWKTIPVGDFDLEFHGDLVFYAATQDPILNGDFVARFTDGQLSWIRLKDSLSNEHQLVLDTQVK